MNSFLEKLLNGQKVEWKTLGEVCEFQNGFAFKSNLFQDFGIPIIRITNVDGKSIDLSDAKYCNPQDYKENLEPYKINYSDILIAMSGATTGKIGFYEYQDCSYLNQRVGKFIPTKEVLNNRYLYHYLLSQVKNIYIMAGGGVQPNLSSNILMKSLQLPLPPLPVQKEIVQILDTLTTHTAELTAENTARKKQYEFYRNQLLTFESGVEWKTLGSVCEVSNTGVDKKINEGEQTITLLNYTDVFRNNYIDNSIPKMQVTASDKKINDCSALYGDIFITPSSETIDEIGIASVITEDLINTCYSYHIMRLRLKEQNFITSCFIRYCFESEILRHQILKNATGLTRFGLTKGRFESLQIPIPPLAVQKEIVEVLDKFHTLTHSITQGLPKEIELRTKQYEFYRNQLLNFNQ